MTVISMSSKLSQDNICKMLYYMGSAALCLGHFTVLIVLTKVLGFDSLVRHRSCTHAFTNPCSQGDGFPIDKSLLTASSLELAAGGNPTAAIVTGVCQEVAPQTLVTEL